MTTHVVVATFIEGTDMSEVLKLVEQEKYKVKELQNGGELGSIRLAVPHLTVFLDVTAVDDDQASRIVRKLPMSKWWELDVYPLSGTA